MKIRLNFSHLKKWKITNLLLFFCKSQCRRWHTICWYLLCFFALFSIICVLILNKISCLLWFKNALFFSLASFLRRLLNKSHHLVCFFPSLNRKQRTQHKKLEMSPPLYKNWDKMYLKRLESYNINFSL